MLIIRNRQIKDLELVRPETFRPRMLQHIANEFPETAEMCGEEGILRIIDSGLSRIGQYGLKSNFEACLFIDMTIMLGTGFDTDPLLPWARKILSEAYPDKTAQIERLMWSATDFQKKAIPEEGGYPLVTFTKMMDSDYDDLEDRIKTITDEEFLTFLNELWPQKFAQIPAEAFKSLFEQSISLAAGYRLTSKEAVRYYQLLMFLLGHRFDMDFQYAWMMNILTDPAYDDEYYKLCSLHFTVQKYFEAIIEASIPLN